MRRMTLGCASGGTATSITSISGLSSSCSTESNTFGTPRSRATSSAAALVLDVIPTGNPASA